jgi:dephospho-CoA kinase
MLIGITGRFGSGKTEAARIFAESGARVISADDIGRRVAAKSPEIRRRLAQEFGNDILTPTGRVRRRILGQRAFSSEAGKKKLNKIVHPELLRELDVRTSAALKRYKIVVIDAALLIDWGLDRKVDLTIVIHTKNRVRMSRLEGKGYSQSEAIMRSRSQLTYEQLRKRADLVIFNNESLDLLRVKIKKIIDCLC